MGFTIAQEKSQVQAAHRFQVSAELQQIQLLDCTATLSESDGQLQGQLRLGLKMETAVLSVSERNARFAVRISVFGDPIDAPEQPERHGFEVACRYALDYELRRGYTPSTAELDAFREGNAILHCWPYSRELVQNLTARMGLPIPPLPLLRLVPKASPKTAHKRAAKSTRKVEEKAGD
ncbi:MAG TPA: hypothetical protein PLP04_09715 [Bryobacteraceae bacterium]|nr:hypothetical protein [Bryobacteraceae bacterium]HOL71122.1 hypothetical protein [Bryobacteraceae bacterium]HPQ15496.1 hypothetical protein [Bryobacteraceae bacterium]